MKEVYLYGAGGHAKVIFDVLKSNDIVLPKIYDDDTSINNFLGIPVSQNNMSSPLIISIGNNAIRKKVVEKLKEVKYSPAVCAKSAIIADSAALDEGTVVMQGAIIQHSAKIGKHCIINTGASIDHDCEIGDFVHIAPHSTLCGNVKVGEGSFIGSGTVVIPNASIGKWSVIGAGSVVVNDIPDYATAYGNPCKVRTI
ncbi:MAG: acetyltransferase [Bacteroidales bacterium]|nr:acetyltransferase [Bacteroidales bacterium]